MQSRLEAVIFDWAGTIVDFGSFAPTQIFVDAFRQAYDFDITLAEARGPMGLGKWQHIEALGRDVRIDARWRAQFNRPMSSADIEHIYRTFLPLQVERVSAHAQLIPGALSTLDTVRRRGLKVGSTTGYPRAVMQRLVQAAAANGYEPDCVVCADDLRAGARPGPWMALQCVLELAAGAVFRCVKIDDTVPGIVEGLNAGMWTVGVALTGSPAGMTLDEYRNATPLTLDSVRERVTNELLAAGAHYVIDSVADLPPLLDRIEGRLTAGDRP